MDSRREFFGKALLSGAALWTGREFPETLARFLAQLPPQLQRGSRIPSRDELDGWARDHTFGLIEKFPLEPDPNQTLIMATALATKVQWHEPFDTTSIDELPSSDWHGKVTRLLCADSRDRSHRFGIVSTKRAGDVAVHSTYAPSAFWVTSVIALLTRK